MTKFRESLNSLFQIVPRELANKEFDAINNLIKPHISQPSDGAIKRSRNEEESKGEAVEPKEIGKNLDYKTKIFRLELHIPNCRYGPSHWNCFKIIKLFQQVKLTFVIPKFVEMSRDMGTGGLGLLEQSFFGDQAPEIVELWFISSKVIKHDQGVVLKKSRKERDLETLNTLFRAKSVRELEHYLINKINYL